MNNQDKLIQIFESCVFHSKINLNKKKLPHFLKIKKIYNSCVISNVGGYQSEIIDLEKCNLNELKVKIDEKVNFYLKNILKINYNLLKSFFWLNINNYKDYNHIHDHPSAILSGVFYIKTPKDCGDIFFVNEFQINHFLPNSNVKEYNPLNSSIYNLKIEEFDLILFPSWIKHGVKQNLNQKEERISLAFNYHIN